MSVSAVVKDGLINQGTTAATSAAEKTTGSSTLGKDDFLQLLVAQMKYQDPLEPTSNTEYISQYATFSQVEQLQNMASSMELSRGSDLVGKTVVVEEKDVNGNVNSDMGVVDYVSYENNKALLWINGSSWSLDAVKEVADADYVEAYAKASALVTALNKLPSVNAITTDDNEALQSILEIYNGMSDYEKSFVASDVQKSLANYSEKMSELLKLKDLSDDNTSE